MKTFFTSIILLFTTLNVFSHEFKFELYVSKKGIDSLYFAADHVVYGDAYIITG